MSRNNKLIIRMIHNRSLNPLHRLLFTLVPKIQKTDRAKAFRHNLVAFRLDEFGVGDPVGYGDGAAHGEDDEFVGVVYGDESCGAGGVFSVGDVLEGVARKKVGVALTHTRCCRFWYLVNIVRSIIERETEIKRPHLELPLSDMFSLSRRKPCRPPCLAGAHSMPLRSTQSTE